MGSRRVALSEGAPDRAMRVSRLALVAVLVLLGVPRLVSAGSPVGVVKVVRGEAVIQRGEQTLPATPGLGLAEGDVLRTGSDGGLGVLLRDDTRISLGPRSEVWLERFAFAPAQGSLALVLRLARGVATYVSGRIAKLAPDAVRVETPVGMVGVRGTHFAARIEVD